MNQLKLIESHISYPFLNQNYNLNDYVLLNIFWLNYIKNFHSWNYFDKNFDNFDEFSEVSISVLSICNNELLKAIIINPIDNYLEKFINETFIVDAFIEEKSINKISASYEVLELYIDLRYPRSLEVALQFLDKFLKEDIPMDEMEALIDEFDEKYSHEFVRVAE